MTAESWMKSWNSKRTLKLGKTLSSRLIILTIIIGAQIIETTYLTLKHKKQNFVGRATPWQNKIWDFQCGRLEVT